MAAGQASMSIRKIPIFYLWAFLGTVAAYLFRLVLARSLAPETYGAFYAVIGFLSFLLIFNDFGLGPAFFFYFAKWRNSPRKARSVFTFVMLAYLFTAFLLGAMLFFFHDWLALNYFHNPSLSRPLLYFSSLFVFTGISVLVTNYYGITGRLGRYASFTNVRTILMLLLSILVMLFAPAEQLLTLYFGAWLASFALTLILYALGVPFLELLTARVDRDVAASVWRYATFMFLSAAGGVLLTNLDVLFITYFRPPIEVGFYAIAIPLAGLFLVLTEPLSIFLQPVIIHHHHRRSTARLRSVLSSIYNAGVFFLLPFTLLLAVFSREAIIVMFGPEYAAASVALSILSVCFFFRALQSLNFAFLYGTGRLRAQMHIIWVGVVVNTVLNALLIPRYGFVAAAWNTLAAFLLMFIVSFFVLWRAFGIVLPVRNWLATTILSIVLLLVVAWLKGSLALPLYPKALVIGFIFIAAYIGIGIFALRIVRWQQLRQLASALLSALGSKEK